MTIRIVTDSTVILPPDIIDKYQVMVVRYYINIGKQE
jgi:fatty acid-binding protein DegV